MKMPTLKYPNNVFGAQWEGELGKEKKPPPPPPPPKESFKLHLLLDQSELHNNNNNEYRALLTLKINALTSREPPWTFLIPIMLSGKSSSNIDTAFTTIVEKKSFW